MTSSQAPVIQPRISGLSGRAISATIVCASVVLPFAILLNGSSIEEIMRAAIVLVYLLALPGLTLIRAARIDVAQWTPGLSIVASIALGVLVSVTWAYVGTGSWQPPFVALGLISVVLAAMRLIIDLREVSS